MLLPYYLVYKALIRAKITLYRLSALVQEGEGEEGGKEGEDRVEEGNEESGCLGTRVKLLSECEGYISIAWYYMSFHTSSELLANSIAKTMSCHKSLLRSSIIIIASPQSSTSSPKLSAKDQKDTGKPVWASIVPALIETLGTIHIAGKENQGQSQSTKSPTPLQHTIKQGINRLSFAHAFFRGDHHY